ncbi:hypothetical protein N9308_03165 [Candidatus Pelagibacter sp.]|nr:hypothetical protein [Candidatus Pelagibacter sp.]
MAITNAQQYKQLMQNGGRIGLRGGGADMGAPDKAADRGKTGYGGSGKAASKGFDQNASPGGQSPEVYGASGPYNPEQALAAAVKVANEKPKGILNQIPSGINLSKNVLNKLFAKQLNKNRIDFIKSQYPEMYDEEEGLVGLPANLQALYDEDKLYTQQAQDVLMNMTSGEMDFPEYMATVKGSPALKYSGNVGNLEKIKNPDGTFSYKEKMGGDGDGAMSDYERRLLALEQATASAATPVVEEDEIINYRLMADGGRAALAEGGMPYEGGIMDLESARQMYGLGKLVKKITRGVKKIAKSPIGKAALAFGAYKLGGMDFGKGGSLFERFGNLSTLQKVGLGIGATSALSGLMTEEEEEQKLYAGADIADPSYIINNPSKYTNPRLMAEGGSTEEPVAKKTMPLLDMDGKEMDLREEGGFVPLGRMERADDVPARLSKNEFVFTADAVRNAGEGDVDKGAEVMYNMMKNLESGGDVSEESQGLEGAREMFQTSQRLEEVI